jgi:uncharacterized protein YbjT (DUF2867 family)
MILVAGGTGFIGQALVKHLVEMGKPVRLLIKPAKESPRLPKGVSIEAAVTSLQDERGMRAAFRDVDVVYHLVSDERRGSKANLLSVDIEGTKTISRISREMRVQQLIYLSHLGADQGSAFALLKTKSLAETHIIRSQVPYTIFRSAVIFGPGDQFTTSLVRLIKYSPGFVFLPGDGSTLLQPIWIEDLVTCLVAALGNPKMINKILAIGGGEYISLRQIVNEILTVTRRKRRLVTLSPVYLRAAALILEQFLPRLPISIHWIDYLGADRTCSLDTLPRQFGILPARFSNHLDYLRGL